MNDKIAHLKTLGLSASASTEEVKKAYRTLAKKYHPDVNPEVGKAKKFQEITTAYQELIDTNEGAKINSAENVKREYTKESFYKEKAEKTRKERHASSQRDNMDFNLRNQEYRRKAHKRSGNSFFKSSNFRTPNFENQEFDQNSEDFEMEKEAWKKAYYDGVRRKGKTRRKPSPIVRFVQVVFTVMAIGFAVLILMFANKHKAKNKKLQRADQERAIRLKLDTEQPSFSTSTDDYLEEIKNDIIIGLREEKEQETRENWDDKDINSAQRKREEEDMVKTYNMKHGYEEPNPY